jgi:hypothetical protein
VEVLVSKKTRQEILDLYLLHREWVRRNPEYGKAYRKLHAINHPERQDLETVLLAERWGLSLSGTLPNPSERPGYDPKPLLKDANPSSEKLFGGVMQTDPLETDAAIIALEHLPTTLDKMSQELNGFLVLLHFPEKPDSPWGLDVIDLRRPKEEIMEAVQDLVDEARKHHRQSPRKLRGLPIGGPKTKGFDYLRVYDLKKQGLTFKKIAKEMWGNVPDDQRVNEVKASKYFRRADARVKNPLFLQALTEQLTRRQSGRVLAQTQASPSLPYVWGKRVWLKLVPRSHRRSD